LLIDWGMYVHTLQTLFVTCDQYNDSNDPGAVNGMSFVQSGAPIRTQNVEISGLQDIGSVL